MSDTPELAKMVKVNEEAQHIGDFVEWLGGKGIYLCSFSGPTGTKLETINTNMEQLLADYFGIDLKKAEQERRSILAELRGEQS